MVSLELKIIIYNYITSVRDNDENVCVFNAFILKMEKDRSERDRERAGGDSLVGKSKHKGPEGGIASVATQQFPCVLLQ